MFLFIKMFYSEKLYGLKNVLEEKGLFQIMQDKKNCYRHENMKIEKVDLHKTLLRSHQGHFAHGFFAMHLHFCLHSKSIYKKNVIIFD